MKLLILLNKIGKQPLKAVQNKEAIVFVRNNLGEYEKHIITGIRYESGKLIGLEAIPFGER